MQSTHISRRSLALTLAALPVGLVIADTSAATKVKGSAAADGLSHTAEAIRQEVTLDATPQRVYQALTATKDFDINSLNAIAIGRWHHLPSRTKCAWLTIRL